MPTAQHSDSKGSYYAWGKSGKHYYYVSGNPKSRAIAKLKADLQGAAIQAKKGCKCKH